MNKYAKILREDAEFRDGVADILNVLDGRKFNEVEKILACVKYFIGEISKHHDFEFDETIIEFATGGEGDE